MAEPRRFVPKDYTLVDLTDHEFAKWLTDRGWTGDYEHAEDFGKLKTTHYLIHHVVVAVVRVKNDAPIGRWICVHSLYRNRT